MEEAPPQPPALAASIARPKSGSSTSDAAPHPAMYRPRPPEFGSGQVEPEGPVDADVTAADFFALADRLGA